MTFLNSRVIRLAVASILGGLLIGLVGGAFRYCLILSDNWRTQMIAWAHHWPYFAWMLPVIVGAGGAYLARLLVVKFAPTAEGSGVQRVEAMFSGEVQPASMSIIPVKFFGGLLAMGSGLALGREGPTVQMGASFGGLVSRFLLKHDEDRRIVDAASAGGGLAVAFNAPIGGSIFVFEELTSNFTPWLLVSTLAAMFSSSRSSSSPVFCLVPPVRITVPVMVARPILSCGSNRLPVRMRAAPWTSGNS